MMQAPERIWADAGHPDERCEWFSKPDQDAPPLVEYIRADLTAPAVRVKPLEWKPWYYGEGLAETIFGTYNVTKTGWLGPRQRKEIPADNPKAAAQADYERRILSAVEAVPVSEVREAALREAAAVVDAEAKEWTEHKMNSEALAIGCAAKAILALIQPAPPTEGK